MYAIRSYYDLLVAGFAEAAFTIAIVTFVKKVSPGTIYEGAREKNRALYGLIALLVCLTPLGLLATGTAWGEWGLEDIRDVITEGEVLTFVPKGMSEGFRFDAIMPDYAISGLPEIASYLLSAAAGVSILIILFKVISSLKKDKLN